MASNQLHNKRRNYFIDKGFQGMFILKFCLIVICSSLLTAGIMYFLGRKSTTVSILDSRVVVLGTANFLLPLLIQTALVVLVIVGIATIAVTLFFSHKIAGPLYRFRKVIEALGEGDFSLHFRIRDYDQLQNLGKELNAMIENIKIKINAVKENISKLKKKSGNISQEDLEELDRNINYFKS
jgi:methyl-accepting chemotaxis protein